MADHVRGLAEDAEARGCRHAAASHFRRASGYYLLGERFRFPKDDDALEVYRQCVRCLRRATELGDGPVVEYIDVPFEGNRTLPSFLVRAQTPNSSRAPVAVFFTGFDGNKEMNWFLGIEELVKRGVSCLSVDSPGVGEAIRFQNIPLRYDYEAAGSAAIDFLEQRNDVDPERIGIIGMSLGGYYATRCAAMDSRFKACVAWGGIWDYHEVWQRRISAAQELHLPVPGRHLPWNTTTSTPGGSSGGSGAIQIGRCGTADHVSISPLPRGRRPADSLVGRAEAVRSGQLPKTRRFESSRAKRVALSIAIWTTSPLQHRSSSIGSPTAWALSSRSNRRSRNALTRECSCIQHCQCRVDNIQSPGAPHSDELATVASIRGCRGDEIAG